MMMMMMPLLAKSATAAALLLLAGRGAVLVWNKNHQRQRQQRQRRKNDNNNDEQQQQNYRENVHWIRTVLDYWFGQYPSLDVAQKKLWMISQQNVMHRNAVDAEIFQKFGQLLLLLLLDNTDHQLVVVHTWCSTSSNDDDDLYGIQGKIAAIIVLDQFSRHIHRWLSLHHQSSSHNSPTTKSAQLANNNNNKYNKYNIPSQATLDQHAYQVAVRLFEQHETEIQAGMVPIPMWIFGLMPYRHAHTISDYQFVQQQIESMHTLQNTHCHTMIAAFRKATNRRLAVLQDSRRRITNPNATTTATSNSTSSNDDNDDINDDDGYDNDDERILECGPFQADLSTAPHHVVYQTIRNFLFSQNILGSASSSSAAAAVIVSLSGGVDSMVICSVLAHLARTAEYQNNRLQVVAVHIDYGNRPESATEAAYLQRHCGQQSHNVTLHVRRIDEVTRGVTARDDYERIARDIRYTLYRETIAQLQQQQQQQQTTTTTIGVMLGHHRGDLRENVLSNAHKGCGPLDLSGMTAVSKNDGVTLYRPLLSLEKTAIYDYAHRYGVPYFKDTTPHWSTRGKLRNKLLPLLQEIYGEGSMNNLSNLAVQSDECRALLYSAMIQPFMDSIVYKPMGIYFPTAPWKDQGSFFWKFVLREALHSAGLGMFTDKSAISFMERCCQTNPVREGWLQCRKDYAVYLQKDGQVFVLFPSSFPWHRKDYFDCNGHAVPYGADTKIGPWQITATVVDDTTNGSKMTNTEIQSKLEEKAIPSMENFMEGIIEYYTQVPTTWQSDTQTWEPRPLVFTKFNKHSRPRAWKGIDLKIQEILPLLGNDKTAINALDETKVSNPVFLAKVTMTVLANQQT